MSTHKPRNTCFMCAPPAQRHGWLKSVISCILYNRRRRNATSNNRGTCFVLAVGQMCAFLIIHYVCVCHTKHIMHTLYGIPYVHSHYHAIMQMGNVKCPCVSDELLFKSGWAVTETYDYCSRLCFRSMRVFAVVPNQVETISTSTRTQNTLMMTYDRIVSTKLVQMHRF